MLKLAHRQILFFVLLAGFFQQPVFTQLLSSVSADLVLLGGVIYTVDAARTWAEAVAIKNGRILFVGATGRALTSG